MSVIENLLNADVEISQKLRLPANAKVARTVASFFSHSGDSWFWLPVLFLIWLFNRNSWHTISAFMAGSILALVALVMGIKFIVRRQRPVGDWGAIYRNTDPHSFPSGHAARSIMLAIICWKFGLQPLAWVLTIWVPLVSLSRVMMGVHYLIDVIVGWVLGFITALGLLALQPLLYSLFHFILF